MKVTLESTTKIVSFNGIDCRVWEGCTESGIPVHAYITLIAVDKELPQEQFARELEEHRVPSVEVQAIPLRLII
jgi:hypothetical protein